LDEANELELGVIDFEDTDLVWNPV
jgi:hypothetical protein